MNQNLDLLIEQLGIAKQNRFGRSTEKVDLDGQFHMIFNEAEIIFSDKLSTEPTLEEACLKYMKSKLSQNAKLSKRQA